MGALLQWPAARGVAGRLASDPSRSSGLTPAACGGRVMEINLPCAVISPKNGGGGRITAKGA